MFRFCIGLLLTVIAWHGPTVAETPRGMTAVDFIEMPRLSAPRLSPDGQVLAFFQSETLWTDNQIVRRLNLIDTKTGAALPAPQLPNQPDPVAWHPSSSGFVFLKPPKDGGKAQAHFYDLATAETEQLTQHGEAIERVIWHPDGSGLYFVAPEQQPNTDRQMLDGGWVIPPFGANADREVWWLDLASGETHVVIAGAFSVRDVSISDNGDALIAALVPDHALDNRHLGDVFIQDVPTEDRQRWTRNQFREAAPKLSPDGTRLAYIASVSSDLDPDYEGKVFVQARGERPQRLLGGTAMEALDFDWDETGNGLYILGNTGLRANLYHYDLASEALRQITEGDQSIRDWSFNAATRHHVARVETSNNPGEIQIMRSETEGFAPITSVYADGLETFRMPVQKAFQWQGRRGAQLEGLLVYPLDYDPTKTYPLVTITHGGPRTSSRFGSWNVSRYLPVLAAEGYLVFLPNHRGGTGYGDRFVRDMVGRYFRNAHHDVMSGIDALIARDLADPDRLIKMGWSAGGHMVNKLITHTDRFAAASSGAGASEWLSMHGESDIRHARTNVFGGQPWQRSAPRRRYQLDSPLTDVWKVSTPTLFFVGEKDLRVPPTQSILMYRGVRATGTPTLLFQAAGEPHNFRKPTNQLFKINTELAWYARFARNETYTPVLPEAAYRTDPVMQPDEPLEVVGSP